MFFIFISLHTVSFAYTTPDICEDLFGVACLDSEGKNKFTATHLGERSKALKAIQVARDKTAKELGYKDFDSALKDKLAKAGLELREPLDEKLWAYYKGEIDAFRVGQLSEPKKLFAASNTCYESKRQVEQLDFSNQTDVAELAKIQTRYDEFLTTFNAKQIELLSKNLPDFVGNHVGGKCDSLRDEKEDYPPEANPEAVKACAKFDALMQQAVSVYRLEGTPQYKAAAEKFVRENLLPGLIDTRIEDTEVAKQSPEVRTAIAKLHREKSQIWNYCWSFDRLAESSADKIKEDFMEEINTSKTTMESMIGHFYAPEKQQQAEQLFNETRHSLKEVVNQFVDDAATRSTINADYDQLQLFWMKMPQQNEYKKGSSGQLVYRFEDEDAAPDNGYENFKDYTLSGFLEPNAEYTWRRTRGKIEYVEKVDIAPQYFQLLDRNRYSLIRTMAHEQGHKIDPNVSQVNGYALKTDYRDLLACYKDNRSIKMEDNQTGETIADYLASEVIARTIVKLPEAQRRAAVISSVEGFCRYNSESRDNHALSCKGVHPENSLRVSGIMGANPNVRNAIGCKKDSSTYKTCGLKDVKLPQELDAHLNPEKTSDAIRESQ